MKSLSAMAIVAAVGLTNAGCVQAPPEASIQADSNDSRDVVADASGLDAKWVSDLVGMNVETATGTRLGTVRDVIVDGYGRQTYAIIAYAGMMGLGNKYTAVPWLNVAEMLQRDRLIMDQVQLENAPVLSRAKPQLSNNSWHRDADDYWRDRVALGSGADSVRPARIEPAPYDRPGN
jgi:sporulation protein YlmC with PRC-barrel domain